MPHKKFYGVIAVVLLLLSSRCQTQNPPLIKGHIEVPAGWKPVVYAIQARNFKEIAASFRGQVLDSARIALDGSFAFPNLPISAEPSLIQLCVQKESGRFPNQFLDEAPTLSNYMPLVIKNGLSIEVMANAAAFQATFSIVKPAAENAALLQLRDIRHAAYLQQKGALQAQDKPADETALLDQEAALHRFQQAMMDFADSCNLLLPALVATRWVNPVGDYERVPEFMVGQCNKWLEKAGRSRWIAQLCEAANRERLPVLAGDIIPDFDLPLAIGDTLTLHSLLGKRLTILDIWASWCAPCRRENREVLVPLWAEYAPLGMQIVGYAIDSSPGAWKAAIAKDSTQWPQASHLSGDATPFMSALRITTIPANFILDANGKVLAKNLHGAALEAFVEAYLLD